MIKRFVLLLSFIYKCIIMSTCEIRILLRERERDRERKKETERGREGERERGEYIFCII